MNVLQGCLRDNFPNIKIDDNNHIRNILNYFKSNHKEDRLLYDCDAYYYKNHAKKEDGTQYTDEEALHGDIMISFWTPYKIAIYQATKFLIMEKNAYYINYFIEKRMDNPKFKKEIELVNERFLDFAEMCYTEGNMMLLPDRKMQERNQLTEDRIDETLYECFSGGRLSHYFKDDFELIEWINHQNLTLLFENSEIKKERIISLLEPSKFTPFYMGLEQIYKFIYKATQIIKDRNNLLSQQH